MIAELRIRNFAIIDSLDISFHKGLNVLTGETGAGKSIIVDAVEVLLGGRADPDAVRTGGDEALLEVLLSLESGGEARSILTARGLSSGEELVLKRSIPRTGKSRAYVNGSLSPTSLLSEIGDALVDIHGQHEHQALLRQEHHLDILDQAGSFGGLRAKVEEKAGQFLQTARELEALRSKERQRAEREDLLRFQDREIAAAVMTGRHEEESLLAERQILTNAERLHALAGEGHEILYAGEGSVVERLSSALRILTELKGIDPSLSPLADALSTAHIQADEAGLALRDYGEKISFDPRRLEALEARLELLGRLKKKYGGTLEEVVIFHERVRKELAEMETSAVRIEECEKLLKERGDAYAAAAGRLSEKRAESSTRLAMDVEKELAGLGMKKTTFSVSMSRMSAGAGALTSGGLPVDPKGIDRVEFLISPNVGEEVKPLARIASGGELSRIMLALKTVLSRRSPGGDAGTPSGVPILIFDEVDAGIGGAAAEVVGRKLKEVAASHQVLCITHLPQIAVYADAHYSVSKEVAGGRTAARVRQLSKDERVEEISRMLAGTRITPKTREHAKEMLGAAR